MDNNKKLPYIETLYIFIGELIVSALVCIGFLIFKRFDYKVLTGALLGSAVTTLNFLFLAVSTTRAFDRALCERGTDEMSEEEADKFAAEHKAALSNAIKISFILRTVTMLLALVLAFLSDFFNVISTLIPLLMLRPIITVEALIRNRKNKEI